jgi:hypothetical protein
MRFATSFHYTEISLLNHLSSYGYLILYEIKVPYNKAILHKSQARTDKFLNR